MKTSRNYERASMRLAAILPCYGRHEQTLSLVPRLLSSSGIDRSDWELICVTQGEPELATKLQALSGIRVLAAKTNVGYWRALKVATQRSLAPILCNLANDLLPGHHWLRKALTAYDATFKDGIGMLGLNDGIRTDQSAHFLISRELLEQWYGQELWPTMYMHSFGDSEMCDRAKAIEKYVIAPFAIMYHNHHFTGAVKDEVYTLGQKSMNADHELYEMRKANQWNPRTEVKP